MTFAGFLLLGGRAADLLGAGGSCSCPGWCCSPLASLIGGLANSQAVLIGARAVQGLGGAVIAPASLTILTTTFAEGAGAQPGLGIWGAMGGAGGAAGVLLGGILTDLLSWRWILFINVPIGLMAAAAAQQLIAEGRNPERARSFDLTGAVTATLGLSLLVLGIVRTDVKGWGSAQTLALMAAGVALLAVFVADRGALCASAADAAANLRVAHAQRRQRGRAAARRGRCSRCGSSSRCTCSRCAATRRSAPASRSCR